MLAVLLGYVLAFAPADAAGLAKSYVAAVAKLNEAQVRRPEAKDERELAAKLPNEASKSLERLLAGPDSPDTRAALARAARAALDLDRIEDFDRARERLAALSAPDAAKLGLALSRPRFLLLGEDGVEREGLDAFARVLDLVLDAYAEVFGFERWSKIEGKKLRVRVHLVPKIDRPPHFAPQFPWHSEIDFPIVDAGAFRSPTKEGQFLLYGLCHELGHVIAMWGSPSDEQDHHAWAHYAGLAIVDRLAESKDPALAEALDVRWRSLAKERERIAKAGTKPGLADQDGVLALFAALHVAVGPEAIGEALIALEREGKLARTNHVRYYALRDFTRALRETAAGKKAKGDLDKILP